MKRFRRCLSTVTQRWTTHHSQRHTFTRHSMDLHLANAQTQILTALIDTNENTIPSTVPRGTAANPDSPQQAPLLHSLPNIPPAIFNYTNNNNKNNNSSDRRNYINSDSNTPSTVQHSTNHFWDLRAITNYFLPAARISSQPHPTQHCTTSPAIQQTSSRRTTVRCSNTVPPAIAAARAACIVCGTVQRVRVNGTLYRHQCQATPNLPTSLSYRPPLTPTRSPPLAHSPVRNTRAPFAIVDIPPDDVLPLPLPPHENLQLPPPPVGGAPPNRSKDISQLDRAASPTYPGYYGRR